MYPQKIKIIKIDASVYELLQKNKDTKIHSVFSNIINLVADGTLITIGSNIPMNKNHVLIDKVNFEEKKITTSSILKPCNSGFSIDEIFFTASHDAIVCSTPYKNKKTLRKEHLKKAKDLFEWLKQQPKTSITNFDNSDYILNYQFKRIYEFFEEETYAASLRLIGLGVGLTPLGDDVLLGYILAKISLGINIVWIPKILSIAKQKTNIISCQSYKDVLDGYYTDQFINMVDEFFEEKTFEHAKLIIDYGATSGAGVLTGFIFGVLPKGGVRNECLESIKKYIL